MEAKDLMIGDWVIDTEFEEWPRVDVVECIEPNRVWLRNGKLYTPIEFIKPVPLTAEILEKNGFTMQRDTVSKRFVWFDDTGRNGTTVSIFLYDPPICGVKVLVKIETDCSHGTGVDSIHNCDIEYVHQLQHALRLCGIEKEIIV